MAVKERGEGYLVIEQTSSMLLVDASVPYPPG
jgi:hypothetical protein